MKNRISPRLRQNITLQRMLLVFLFIWSLSFLHAQQLAFPGAEGYGRFTMGGREGKVIEVTNLNDSGSGSLRAAIQSYGIRTVVFRVSGTIELKSELKIENSNITIAGQTAPGDGICIRNHPVTVSANNVIIRYLRFRLGDEKQLEADAISGRNRKNIIIDHCSMSWSIDEASSFYDNENFTMQWCLISESLYNSYHSKGAHGYGGIWGGKGATFHHNLFAHHSSRNPRFQGSRNNSTPVTEIVDHRNNVIYNWGGNSAYGGEAGNQNMIANYYKYGPATGSSKNRIVQPYHDDKYGPYGKWYITDNYVYGYPDITADNWNGGVQGSHWEKVRVDSPHPFAPVLTYTAEEAYELVLADVGAVLPKRDAIDARIIEEVRTGTATYGGTWGAGSGIIDSQTEVGGWPILQSATPPTDTDHDGMPDDWETANGLDLSDPEDRNGDLDGDGYTNLEEYLNSLCSRENYIKPPIGLIATAISSSQIDLVWRENTIDETGFSIERSEGNSSSFIEVATVGANDTSYSDTELSPAIMYYYQVRAYHDHDQSIYTSIAEAKTIYADGRPAEAANPMPADSTDDVIIISTLRWTAGAAATSHGVYFGTTNPPEFQGNQTGTTFDPHGLLDSTTYYWRIDEVNDAGTTTGYLWHFITESFTPELIAYWPFNRGMGSLAQDATYNMNYGYLNNMEAGNWVDGFDGKALEFDGLDDYVLVHHDELIDFHIRGFSISFWIRQSGDDIIAPWISKRIYQDEKWGKGYEVYHDVTGKVCFVVADDTIESCVEAQNTDFVTGDWVFVTALRDRGANQLHLYANGVLKASADDNTYNISQDGELYIGTNANLIDFHKGFLDDIRIYNYALNSTEVNALYLEYTTGIEDEWSPNHYKLALKNYPNPFNPKTKITYTVPEKNRVSLIVFNLQGQEVTRLLDEIKSAGDYSLEFDASSFGSGIYLYQLNTGGRIKTKKMMLIK